MSEILELEDVVLKVIPFASPALSGKLPLLTSHCPGRGCPFKDLLASGWTVYAEKAACGESWPRDEWQVVDPVVLPQLARLRPPQHVPAPPVRAR